MIPNFFPYGSDEYWEQLSRMANYAQLWFVLMEADDLRNSELGAMLGEQNQNYLEVILKNQEEIIERLTRLEEKLNAE